jgi:predicted PurR-regulated permease PerM
VETATWQKLAFVGVAASAAVFLAGSTWQAIGALAPVIGLFFGGWLLSCLLEPAVTHVACRTRAARGTVVLGTYAVLVALLTLVAFAAAPNVESQVRRGIATFPAQVDTATFRAVDIQSRVNAWLTETGVPLQVDVVSSTALDNVADELRSRVDPAAALNGGMQVLGGLATILLLSVFFLLGGPQLADQTVQWFGERGPDVRFVLDTLHDAFEGFARTQLLQAVLFGAGVWVCLAAAQVEAAPLVAFCAGALLIVPVVGSVFAVAVPLVATILWNPSATIVVGVALVLYEQLVLNVIGPRLMSRQLGMPPLLVLFALLAGGQIAGFWGAIFGIPTLAAAMTLTDHFWTHRYEPNHTK